jgi:hypothetical protein
MELRRRQALLPALFRIILATELRAQPPTSYCGCFELLKELQNLEIPSAYVVTSLGLTLNTLDICLILLFGCMVFNHCLCTSEKVAENGDLGGCFLHAFHRTPSCRAILKYNTVPLPHRHPLPHRSPPQPDSSNSLLQNSPEVSCKCRKVLRSKREVVLQWWYGLAEKDFSKL